NLEPELVAQVEHLGHFVGAITVVLDQDVAAQHLGQGFELQVARRWVALVGAIPLVPLVAVALSLNERAAVSGHVSHPGGRTSAGPGLRASVPSDSASVAGAP